MQVDNCFINQSRPLKRRVSMQQYQELFQAMFKIKDKEVQTAIINAINGLEIKKEAQLCFKCNKDMHRTLVNASTQTIDHATVIPPIVRRKRIKCFPQVIKKSQHTPEPVNQIKRPLLKRKMNDDLSAGQSIKTRRQSTDSVSVLLDFVDNICSDSTLNDILTLSTITVNDIQNQMLTEWKTSETIIDGFLPIHEAIMDNDLNKLKRQIFVWETKKIPLVELLTIDNNDPLQLSLKHDCNINIIRTLLEANMSLDTLDECSNNPIHLALLNGKSLDINCLQILLDKINPNLLLHFNDEGYTPLHIAVRNNHHIACEALLEFVDSKLGISNEMIGQNLNIKEKIEIFKDKYHKKCDALWEDGETWLLNEKSKFKKEVLNAIDMKRGCTSLFFALENEYYPIIYLLLSHLADPNVRNHCGQTAKMFFSEFGNNTKIEKLLTKVDTILQKQKINI